MRKIISASRRTDIPAFYGDWFMNRLKEGFAGYVNPFWGQKYTVSLTLDNVACFVFWSKNFIPFVDKLKTIDKIGYKFYFNYTINGFPYIFERNVLKKDLLIDNLKKLSDMYSPEYINWRYDPIIISDITNYDFNLKNFDYIASKIEKYVERCFFSFVFLYGKVKKNFIDIQKESRIKIYNPDNDLKIKLANKLADIANQYGIKMYSCCGDYLLGPKIEKAHCIDAKLIKNLFYNNKDEFKYRIKPTRKECGCTESTDIGTYNTCAHGCMYCYANINKKSAYKTYKQHDKNTAFLGYSKTESDKWLDQTV